MKIVHRTAGIIVSLTAIVVLLITSFEIGIYSDFEWYEKEYEKYDVLTDLEMEMEDVMDVTHEMMSYLRGDRENLEVNTVVDGEEREFFNDREKSHMVDVRNLFLGGLDLRMAAGTIAIVALLILVFTKADWKKILPQSFLIGLGSFIVLAGAIGVLIATDFNKYFVLFHEIFFENDLWLLDPDTDLMIRMLPEGFFFDMVVRIGSIFIILLIVFIVISIFVLCKQENTRRATGENKRRARKKDKRNL